MKEVKSCTKRNNKVTIYALVNIKYKTCQQVMIYLQISMSVRLEHLENCAFFIFDNTRQKPYSGPENRDILVN